MAKGIDTFWLFWRSWLNLNSQPLCQHGREVLEGNVNIHIAVTNGQTLLWKTVYDHTESSRTAAKWTCGRAFWFCFQGMNRQCQQKDNWSQFVLLRAAQLGIRLDSVCSFGRFKDFWQLKKQQISRLFANSCQKVSLFLSQSGGFRQTRLNSANMQRQTVRGETISQPHHLEAAKIRSTGRHNSGAVMSPMCWQ